MSILDQVVNHMEFLGYQITREEKFVRAKHEKNLNLVMQSFNTGVLFTAFIGTNDLAKRDILGFMDCLNTMNQKAMIPRFYKDKDGDLVIESWYPHLYDRTQFGIFVEQLNTDMRLVFNDEIGFPRYWA